jgi:hypothetical protein
MVWSLTIRNRDTINVLNPVHNRVVRMTFVLLTMLSTGKVCNSQDTPPRSNPDIEILKKNDVRMGPPGSGDWLSIHDEKGQTFKQYVEGSPVRAGRYQSKIYLQPIGEFSPIQTKVIAYTAEYLRIFFDRSTVVLKALPDSVIPESGRRNHQLHTGTILDLLEQSLPADGIVIMAISSRDLFPNRRWNFVFGQARPSNRVGVSSLYRYSPLRMDSSKLSDLPGTIDQNVITRDRTYVLLPTLHQRCLSDEWSKQSCRSRFTPQPVVLRVPAKASMELRFRSNTTLA